MGRINVVGVSLTVLIDGLAIYFGALLSMRAAEHFSATARIKHKTSDQYYERAHAWYIIMLIGVVGLVAAVATGWLTHAGESIVWVLTVFGLMFVVGMSAGQDVERKAQREQAAVR